MSTNKNIPVIINRKLRPRLKGATLTPLILCLAAIISVCIGGCSKEQQWLQDDELTLKSSCDTLSFDTVFTTVGTVTRHLTVMNPYSQTVNIAEIRLENGNASRFRINVDGDTGTIVRNVLIEPGDSIFIFVQANINPNNESEPFLIEDAVAIDVTGHGNKVRNRIILEAYGRNAVYHLPDHIIHDSYGNAYPYSIINCRSWNHSLPHVIMGYAVVDEDSLLCLQAGEKLYFGTDAVLWVYDGGTLRTEGTQGDPVLFTSMRHDGHYDQLPGQWGHIWLSAGCRNNVISHTVIENATVGILADTVVGNAPTLTIDNTVVRNHSLAGIVGQGTWIEGDNLLVHNCGTAALALQYGGRYRFNSSTFANYWAYSTRKGPAVVINNYYTHSGTIYPRPIVQANFTNCIIAGSLANAELLLDQFPTAAFNTSFTHCLLATTADTLQRHSVIATGNIYGKDPMFTDHEKADYHISADSPAAAAGTADGMRTATDLDGTLWHSPPAIGAYEIK